MKHLEAIPNIGRDEPASAGDTEMNKNDKQRHASPTLNWLASHQSDMVALLRELVVHESPTHEKSACDDLASLLAGHFERIGGRVKLHRQASAGNHLQVDFPGAKHRSRLLLLGHYDTVYDKGTLKKMPWREDKGRLHGPGAFDMKGGIVQMLFALQALQQSGTTLPRPITMLLVSDEEEGSATSRTLTEKLAGESAAVLVCEPSGPGGALKTARKGVGGFTITVTGVASHAGLDFQKGHSAILELARQVEAIAKLTNLQHGITLNVGVIRGGTRTNVVAAEAMAEVDLRIARKSDGAVMERKIRRLRPFDKHCKLLIEGGVNRPPMERTKQVAALFALARQVGTELGMDLTEIAVGGGSDGNFTAGMGIPTLDGLGAAGDGAHAAHEFVVADELPRRAALLAGLIQAI